MDHSIGWTGTVAGALGAWYETVTDGVKLLVDATGDAVADFGVFLEGVSSLKHSDILGVINNAPLFIGEVNNAEDPVIEAGSDDEGDPIASGLIELGHDGDGDALLVSNAGVQQGIYGSLTLAVDGNWIYTLDNSSPGLNELDEGETTTDTFEIAVTDGLLTSNNIPIVITIAGANDVPSGGGLPPDPTIVIVSTSDDFFIA